MNITKLTHYAKKVRQAGLLKSLYIVNQRLNRALFQWYWMTRAVHRKAARSYRQVARSFNFDKDNDLVASRKALVTLDAERLFAGAISKEQLCLLADGFVSKRFDLLGSGAIQFSKIPWHQDFRLHAQHGEADTHFSPHTYYTSIMYHSRQEERLYKDIKVPWELSRCYHFVVLALAYQKSNDRKYAESFVEQITDWIEKNPFLLGVNWKCPMEVGIRVTNWIWAFTLFKNAPSIGDSVWKKLVASLSDHMFFLEHNWEIYDGRTSNHYLSNLVGYIYLCFFFQGLSGIKKKQEWCIRMWVEELEKQVFHEGTDYEGSTHYHRLVTELFCHLEYITVQLGHTLPETVEHKIDRMIDFIQWCTPGNGQLISIGDNDSGRVTYFQSIENLRKRTHTIFDEGIKNYPQFGVTFIKNYQWHLSFRHQAYQPFQPSGHMHNDALSITLARHGIDLFVDPGSFIYTPSAVWRNRFRSVMAHNTFFLDSIEPVPFDEQLFGLALPARQADIAIEQYEGGHYAIDSYHDLYKDYGLRAHRKVEVNLKDGIIVITDWWEALQTYINRDQTWVWNFTFSPFCSIDTIADKVIVLHNGIPLVQIESELVYQIDNAYVSFEYGSMLLSKKLQAQHGLKTDKKMVTIIRGI